MLTEKALNNFFVTLKMIEDIAPKIAEEIEQIHNSIFGYTFSMAQKDHYPSVHIDSEEGVSVEYYLGSGNSDSLLVPLYAFTDPNWQQIYKRTQETEFETRKEKIRQKAFADNIARVKSRKKQFEELKKEFGETK